ncbi:hypothetical protein CEXT_439351 [Caerostris extrusa]|uniref:Uncharacterized protein n=1 Tax=Caerostris extrusa TaxID=172846 RepID=A0AAV4TJ89_CAEEX|nr:hypothetical protein CEXT_439351 [Caerostris extrusa]
MSQSLEEEMGEGGSEDNVLKATMLFKSIMDLTYKESLKAKDKVQIRELVTNMMQIIQVQNKSIFSLIGANNELEKLLVKKLYFFSDSQIYA